MRRQVFLVWLFVFLIWTFYRIFVSQSEFVDEVIAKPLFFLFPVILVVVGIEKKPLSEIGFRFTLKSVVTDIFIATLIGSIFVIEAILVNRIKYGELSFSVLPVVKATGGLLPFSLITLSTVASEEILSRGYIFNRLLQAGESEIRSTVITTVLFILLHLPIFFTKLQFIDSTFYVYLFSLTVLSITACFFSRNRSFLLPILIHFFWSITVSLYL
ncbi:hypothetical protein A3D77_00590 [Candidatus Gottesmanbacteria bacterium RIFCSPHIGHO2_02_FULL_39_11]|uniref:CAAX prenyl protease 2/Lysostaphin resistance protein A-like domain-containing protein n=1 Tax=Candidatus Gottesmanbacteria bacterium RIFCSPHIGHO2_02_FULL_39_11 TaxID=1798382 RepID=A0A1F5ZLK3_9BACT|nr:MAG: hypothetical protein A3D77_00590 [Candidatus Gottesmanbacteria bacterium RIFCSPHIGHO2_02_FULL_39_11]